MPVSRNVSTVSWFNRPPVGVKAWCLTLFLLLAALPGAHCAESAPGPAKRPLVVAVKAAPPFAMRQGADGWDGISIDLWTRVAAELGYEFKIAELQTMSELLEGIASGKFDVAIGAITVTAEREKTLDFAQPYFSTGLGIAVPLDNVLNWTPVFRTMTSLGFLQAIASLVGLTLFTGLIVWLIERRANDAFGRGARGLTSSVWWSTLAMTQRSPVHAGPQTIVGRVVAILWIVTSIIALAVFTASVTSILTARHLQGAISNVADLTSARVGTVEGTAAVNSLARLNIGFTEFPSVGDGLRALRRGRSEAFVYDKSLLAWHVRQDYPDAIRVLETTFEPQNYAFALPIDSPFRKSISVSVLTAIHSDWWTQVKFRYLGPN